MPKILIIDDDLELQEVLKKRLEHEGFEVMTAPDGKKGMKLYRQHAPDLVLTDIIMPEKEGLETIMELTKENSGVKIFAMSGGGINKGDDYLVMAKQFGANRIFRKPVDQNELVKAVKEVLA